MNVTSLRLCGLIFVFSLLLVNRTIAQDFFAEDAYYTADDQVAYGEYAKAIPLFKDIEKNDPTNSNIQYQLGMCYFETGDNAKALSYLSKAIQKTSLKYAGDANEKSAPVFAFFYMGKVCLAIGKIEEAITHFDKYKSFLTRNNKSLIKDVDRQLGYCYNAKKFIKYPIDVQVSNIGAIVNTPYPEYSPIISSDGTKLVFTTRRKGSTGNLLDNNMKYYEDIFITRKEGGTWSAPEKISPLINTNDHEACLSLSNDGKRLYIYKSVDQNGDIFISKLENDKWTTPKSLGSSINSKFLETHACESPDGKTLYFVSNKKGGLGGTDIYKSKLQADGSWGKAENLGPSVNSPFDEEAPFMHADGKSLFFSSQGRESMGGYDIFTTKITSDGFWSVPQNIGYPLNTTGDDIFYNPSTDPTVAYFSSVRDGGLGEQDLYEVKIKKEKELFAVIKGSISDPISFKPIDAKIEIKDAKTQQTIALILADDSTGNYDVSLPANADYKISVTADNFQTRSENVHIDESQKGKEISKNMQLAATGAAPVPLTPSDASASSLNPVSTKTTPVAKKVEEVVSDKPSTQPKPTTSSSFPLQLVEKNTIAKPKSYNLEEGNYTDGEKFVMNNIYYDYGKATLRPESKDELNRLVNFLKKLKTIKVEVSGHTDNISSADFNKDLSKRRAKSVVDYLVNNGVNASRLEYQGYGFDQPISTNTTDEGRQSNRRTEIKIIGGGKQIAASEHNATAAAMTTNGVEPPKSAEVSVDNSSVVFKVQFASSTGQKSLSDPVFKGLQDINVYQENGRYKYTLGESSSIEELQPILINVKQLGFSDAYIVKFVNGAKRVAAPKTEQAFTDNSKDVFRIQVTAIGTKKPITSTDFKGLQGLVVEQDNGVYKYFLGKETSYEEALKVLDEVKAKGFNDAFIKKL